MPLWCGQGQHYFNLVAFLVQSSYALLSEWCNGSSLHLVPGGAETPTIMAVGICGLPQSV